MLRVGREPQWLIRLSSFVIRLCLVENVPDRNSKVMAKYLEVLEGSLVCDDCLCAVAEDCKHGQAAVLDLLGLQVLQSSLAVPAKARKVEEGATWKQQARHFTTAFKYQLQSARTGQHDKQSQSTGHL